jgi:DNA-binding NarL/FixJ family response regulator
MNKTHDINLSDRQCEVLKLLSEGLTAKEIAMNLSVSSRTVEYHKYNIMKMLGVTTTAELIQYSIMHHITNLPEK